MPEPLGARALEHFLRLAAIASPSGEEAAVVADVRATLLAAGLTPEDGGTPEGAATGNLLCRLPATAAGAPALLLCAHVDTVPVEGPLQPVVEDGVVRNAGGAILGADDKSGAAALLELAELLAASGRPHGELVLAFTVQEEVGLRGAKALPLEALGVDLAIVLDEAAPPGTWVARAPEQRKLDVTLAGRAAHAGVEPEDGRSAIAAAAAAIASLPLGRQDDGATLNIGRIEGGAARNVVPAACRLLAEARALDADALARHVARVRAAFEQAAAAHGCELRFEQRSDGHGYALGEDDPAVALALAGIARAGLTPQPVASGAASDANVLIARGLPSVSLGTGMAAVHTPRERLPVADLATLVSIALGVVEAALPGGAPPA